MFLLNKLSHCQCIVTGENERTNFLNLVEANGSLHIGATDVVVQLRSADLSVEGVFYNGPGVDSDICSGPLFCGNSIQSCLETAECRHNYNSLFLAYRDRLLVCGSLHRSCDLLTLTNVTTRYGNESDLKCRNEIQQQYIGLSSRTWRSIRAAIYINQTHIDQDILFVGSHDHNSFTILLAPSEQNSYFSLIHVDEFYQNQLDSIVTLLVWTTDMHGYILWKSGDDTSINSSLILTRYCVEEFFELTRDTLAELKEFGFSHQTRSNTQITLRCDVALATEFVSAKFVSDILYLMFASNGSTTVICSSSIASLNKEFNFVRKQCWNSTQASTYVRILKGDLEQTCRASPMYEEYWVSPSFRH